MRYKLWERITRFRINYVGDLNRRYQSVAATIGPGSPLELDHIVAVTWDAPRSQRFGHADPFSVVVSNGEDDEQMGVQAGAASRESPMLLARS